METLLAAVALVVLATAVATPLILQARDRRRDRRPALEGRTAIVNTPKPDDQALRGVVIREINDRRGVVLAGAVYLEPGVDRGQPSVDERPAGDVVIPLYSFAQIITPAQ